MPKISYRDRDRLRQTTEHLTPCCKTKLVTVGKKDSKTCHCGKITLTGHTVYLNKPEEK